MTILVIAEHNQKKLRQATHHTISAAHEISDQIDVLVIGHQCDEVAAEAATVNVVNHVLYANSAVYANQLAENTALLVADLAKKYQYVLAPATTFGKNLLPRVAALLDVGMVSDVIKVIDAQTFQRPIYAGNALATVVNHAAIKCLTIRTTAFAPAEISTKLKVINHIDTIFENSLSTFVSADIHASTRPDLTSAKIVISGGRGLKNAENFKLLEKLADRLGAAIGASRAAVDAGFAPNDYQVGQTGKVVAPELYIAIGISGAIQHIAGMKDSKVIVAINNDPDAPIFQIADYGLVMDLFSAINELDQVLTLSAK